MRVIFRADASWHIGSGHVMRCLTLADALTTRGTECQFICRAHPGHLADFIRQKGYPVHLLDVESDLPEQDAPLAHASWLGASMEQDAAQTAALLARLQPDWLVVDHYALDARWETLQRPHAGKLMVIDDLADRRHDCDLLLDQNLGRLDADYAELVPPHCQRLLGSTYALLRPEFVALREYSLQRRQPGMLRTLLISMGGVDKDNATGRILQALFGAALPQDCRITVVMGATAPWLEEVKAQAATLPWSTEVSVNVGNMAQLMADADLAIGAAGSTSWERCCLGLPCITVCLAQNQQFIIQSLKDHGAVLESPSLSDNDFSFSINESIGQLNTNRPFLNKLSKSASKICHGNGAILIIDKLSRS
ncbi:UDP-2,4-diacetamido-2,4,6-trideoxy-beta-L-altropyranose hydrolase [Laribacter hongkongensis]|uniref:UDP-2,4-diacetamido-2,4, 6-trideoxy-beta-L-altropyranose hydrolase n=1 Tax=Laribacter hongkongensis TaxID=168471 RepID=UPI001EFCD3CC|nr:UDP-2,4-diacetamido-2,4,6-trideoxy-beta-L-altropyranose hydrolase [Laribacter hongkongensis]MCG9042275.1 UDP-2,4-diacetamido-2,4,6-trideoxy-beta-L-altropyranose hydrolase [Laribacter hongkongensis]MCG9057161.1 UDP-2,4-diacetamido-2,4,6-trideoxy-beta-L-altropyranose hydrolase [Laribacter hongkongensis]MCG9069194.1 UDP-2,4-diacetamido-2,4,6-trideoxy-beta-L-altropyranose hydrolase [Laribacter hongkongensis]